MTTGSLIPPSELTGPDRALLQYVARLAEAERHAADHPEDLVEPMRSMIGRWQVKGGNPPWGGGNALYGGQFYPPLKETRQEQLMGWRW